MGTGRAAKDRLETGMFLSRSKYLDKPDGKKIRFFQKVWTKTFRNSSVAISYWNSRFCGLIWIWCILTKTFWHLRKMIILKEQSTSLCRALCLSFCSISFHWCCARFFRCFGSTLPCLFLRFIYFYLCNFRVICFDFCMLRFCWNFSLRFDRRCFYRLGCFCLKSIKLEIKRLKWRLKGGKPK